MENYKHGNLWEHQWKNTRLWGFKNIPNPWDHRIYYNIAGFPTGF